MDIYSSMFSQTFILNEQIARQIFETIPDQGPVIAIIDTAGNLWPSDSQEFARLNIDESFLKELCMKIDDGVEPVITQVNDSGCIGAQLITDKNNCGYLFILLPKYTPESILANIELIEMLMNQFALIAKLIEKNNHFFKVHPQKHITNVCENFNLN